MFWFWRGTWGGVFVFKCVPLNDRQGEPPHFTRFLDAWGEARPVHKPDQLASILGLCSPFLLDVKAHSAATFQLDALARECLQVVFTIVHFVSFWCPCFPFDLKELTGLVQIRVGVIS